MTKPNVVALMGRAEARRCVEAIKGHLESTRARLLELHERQGWRALGYPNWRECVAAEFGQSQAHLYRQLTAAQVERDISQVGENGTIPEGTLRPLAALPDAAARQAVWQEATAEGARPTAARVAQLTAKALAALPPEEQLEIVQEEGRRAAADAQRAVDRTTRQHGERAEELAGRLRGLAERLLATAKRTRRHLSLWGGVGRRGVRHAEAIIADVRRGLAAEDDRAAA